MLMMITYVDIGDDIMMSSSEACHEMVAITHLHIHDSSACLVSHCHHPRHNSGDSHGDGGNEVQLSQSDLLEPSLQEWDTLLSGLL